jgi:hypothetical protein
MWSKLTGGWLKTKDKIDQSTKDFMRKFDGTDYKERQKESEAIKKELSKQQKTLASAP